MTTQNYTNHRRLVPMYHYVGGVLLLAIFIGSIVNFVNSAPENKYSAALIVASTVLLGIVAAFTRLFALKAQDRAIRAEENLRHYVLTGKLLNRQLRLSQIIALRFASDDEFPALAEKAVAEKMKANDIKKAIINWRADYNRV